MLGRRRGVEAGLRDPGSPLRAPLLVLHTPPSRLRGAELGDHGCPEKKRARLGARGGARAGWGAERDGARWAPGFGDSLGWRRRRRRTGEAGRHCPSRIFLRSGLAVHNSIAGSPYPKKHSRRALSSRTRQPPESERASERAIAEARTSPKRLRPRLLPQHPHPPLATEDSVLFLQSFLRSPRRGSPTVPERGSPAPNFLIDFVSQGGIAPGGVRGYADKWEEAKMQ